MSEEKVDVLTQGEKADLPSVHYSIVLFYPSPQRVGHCQPTLVRKIFFIQSAIQMLVSSRNILPDVPGKNILPALCAARTFDQPTSHALNGTFSCHRRIQSENTYHISLSCLCVCVCAQSCLSPWTVACQAFLSMEFSRQEYWSGLPHVSAASCNLERFHSLPLSVMTLTFVKNAVLPTCFFHLRIKRSSLCVVRCLGSVSCRFAKFSAAVSTGVLPSSGCLSAGSPCPPSPRRLLLDLPCKM